MAPSYACDEQISPASLFCKKHALHCTLHAWVIGTLSKLARQSLLQWPEVKLPKNDAVCVLGNDLSTYS